MEKRLYLAYGSNLSEAQMEQRCPDAVIVGKTNIQNYQLMFRKSRTGHYATIDKKEGSIVPAVVSEISADDEANLDRCEGYPAQYQKYDLRVDVTDMNGKEIYQDAVAMVYILPEERALGAPTDIYFDKLDKGYESFGFSKEILLEALKKSGTASKMRFE